MSSSLELKKLLNRLYLAKSRFSAGMLKKLTKWLKSILNFWTMALCVCVCAIAPRHLGQITSWELLPSFSKSFYFPSISSLHGGWGQLVLEWGEGGSKNGPKVESWNSEIKPAHNQEHIEMTLPPGGRPPPAAAGRHLWLRQTVSILVRTSGTERERERERERLHRWVLRRLPETWRSGRAPWSVKVGAGQVNFYPHKVCLNSRLWRTNHRQEARVFVCWFLLGENVLDTPVCNLYQLIGPTVLLGSHCAHCSFSTVASKCYSHIVHIRKLKKFVSCLNTTSKTRSRFLRRLRSHLTRSLVNRSDLKRRKNGFRIGIFYPRLRRWQGSLVRHFQFQPLGHTDWTFFKNWF